MPNPGDAHPKAPPTESGRYSSLAKGAMEAGHAELAERLTQYVGELASNTTGSTDPNWVFWDRRDLIPERKQHISPDSELYDRNRREVREELNGRTGYRKLDTSIVDSIARQPERRMQAIDEKSEDIETSRKDWLDLLKDEDIDLWVKHAIAKELVVQGLYMWQYEQDVPEQVENCSRIIEDLSVSEFYDFMERHTKTYEAEAQKMSERFVEYERQFREKLNLYVSTSRIPLSRDKAIKRLEQVRISPLDQVTRKASTISGDFDPSSTHTYVVVGHDIEDERNTYFHERLHAISGRTALYDPKYYSAINTLDVQRAGLRFDVGDTRRFAWLDEAITTELANEMSGSSSGVYAGERKLKGLVLRSGKQIVPKRLLINAYFEDYEPDATVKIPAWKKLYKVVNAMYEPGFLLKVDKVVEEKGVEAGIEFMQSMHQAKD